MVKFNLKKKVAKALVFAMAMGVIGVHSSMTAPAMLVQADGEDQEPAKSAVSLTIDYAKYEATIKAGTDDTYVFLDVLKKDDDTKPATYAYKVGTVGSEDNSFDGVVIDLSFLKATSDLWVRAYGNVNTETTKLEKLTKQDKKVAIKFVAAQYVKDNKEKLDPKKSFTVDKKDIGDDIDKYEYKTLYGSDWDDLKNLDLDTAVVAGTTIMIRKAAVPTKGDVAGSPAGPEVKVKISAIPKAPKVAVDYVKGTIKLPKDSEYGQLLKDGTIAWKDNAAAKAWTLDELRKEFNITPITNDTTTEDKAKAGDDTVKSDSFTLVVRTKAGKKAASAVAFISVDDTKALDIQSAENGNGGVISLTAANKLTWENTTKGIKLTAANVAFEYYDEAKKTWKTVAANKTVEVKMENGKSLDVRAAGVKPTKENPTGTFASAKTTITCSILPATITVTASKEKLTAVGDTATCTVKILDGNKKELKADDYTITWSTSDEKVATVNNGVVTAVADGTVTITATCGNVKNTVKITVEIPKATN